MPDLTRASFFIELFKLPLSDIYQPNYILKWILEFYTASQHV